MSNLIRIADLVLNRPLLVHPDKVPLILNVLSGRIPLIDSESIADFRAAAEARIADLPEDAQAIMRGPAPDASRFFGSSYDVDPVTGREVGLPYRRTPEGVAIISVLGALANRGTSLTGGSMSKQSYEGLKFQLAHAAADPKTTSVILDLESPGGQAIGAFEAADAVRALAEAKVVVAVPNGMAASAAFAIASGATKIVVPPTGIVGSIGVVMVHMEVSRALAKEGVTPTLIFAGAHKVDGNPLEPLSKEVRADLQAEIDQVYEMFVETVAKGRPRMTSKAVRDTEARTYMGADAVRAGLADEVGTFEDVLADLSRRGDRRASTASARGMSMANDKGASAAEANAGIPKEQHDAAVAAARAEGVAEGTKAGATAERTRIGAILSLEEAKGRQTQALAIATSTDLSAEQAKVILGASAATSAPAAARAGGSPIGIVVDDKSADKGANADALSADDIAASLNKEFGALRF